MEKIYIVGDLADFNNYQIWFKDDTGESMLAVTRSEAYADKLVKRFREYLRTGRLLPVYKSVYK